VSDLYAPAVHVIHDSPVPFGVGVYPAKHPQSSREILPGGELVSAGHNEQAAAFGTPLNFPAVHAVQEMLRCGDLVPTGHGAHTAFLGPLANSPAMHSVQELLFASENVPPGQSEHPSASAFWPGLHGEHTPTPGVFLNSPGGHAVHGAPSDFPL
jgi:hypothetical protein